jgi:DNA-directed RNA polymerase subunit RPC12/RpoP
MSIAFKCTTCGRGLRANPDMVGKRTKCPGCATVLTIPGPEAPAPAAAPAKTSPTAANGTVIACEACGTKIRAKPEWAGKAIKCPKCQGRISVPAAAAASPIKAAPAKKPAPPPPEEAFEDEDAGGMADGNDEAEAPPARKKAAAPKKKSSVMTLLIVLLLLVLAGGGGFAAWVFFFQAPTTIVPPQKRTAPSVRVIEEKETGKPILAAAGDPFASVPSDAGGFINVKPRAIVELPLVQKFLAGENSPFGKVNKQVLDAFEVGPTDIDDAIMVMLDIPDPNKPNFNAPGLLIVAMSKSLNPKGFEAEIGGAKFELKESNGKPYYLFAPPGEKPMAIVQTGTRVIVMAPEKEILKYIEVDRPQTGPLTPMLKEAAAGNHLVYLGNQMPPPKLEDKIKKDVPPQIDFMANWPKAVQLTIAEDNKALQVAGKLHFDDAEKVASAKKMLDGFLEGGAALLIPLQLLAPKAPPELFKIAEEGLKTVKTSAADNALEIGARFPISLEQVSENLMPLLMQMKDAGK